MTSTSRSPIAKLLAVAEQAVEVAAIRLQVGGVEDRPEDALHLLDVLADADLGAGLRLDVGRAGQMVGVGMGFQRPCRPCKPPSLGGREDRLDRADVDRAGLVDRSRAPGRSRRRGRSPDRRPDSSRCWSASSKKALDDGLAGHRMLSCFALAGLDIYIRYPKLAIPNRYGARPCQASTAPSISPRFEAKADRGRRPAARARQRAAADDPLQARRMGRGERRRARRGGRPLASRRCRSTSRRCARRASSPSGASRRRSGTASPIRGSRAVRHAAPAVLPARRPAADRKGTRS